MPPLKYFCMALLWQNVFLTFAIQHSSTVNFKFAVWLQYCYVTAIHKLTTLE